MYDSFAAFYLLQSSVCQRNFSCSCSSQFWRNPHKLSEDCKLRHSLFSVKYNPAVFLPKQ